MNVFYFYYYLFYKKFGDPDPWLAATLGFTTLETFFIIAFFDFTSARFFCFEFNKYYMMTVLVITFLANTFYFFTSKKVKLIVKSKPRFFNNHWATIIFILIFSLFVISTMFWMGDCVNRILADCHR